MYEGGELTVEEIQMEFPTTYNRIQTVRNPQVGFSQQTFNPTSFINGAENITEEMSTFRRDSRLTKPNTAYAGQFYFCEEDD